jgi:2-methylcitrate dehydratase PrpD
VTLVEQVAGWAAELDLGDVPAEVLSLSRAQRAAVLGGVAGSAGDDASRRVLAAVDGWAAAGPAPLVGTNRQVAVEDAVYAAAALSVALDFDDYVSFGHTGHSAVLVPALLAAETGSSGPAQLVAQVIANEVEARLGGACLIGPLNGQLWSFIHAAGTALAAGRLLDLDAPRLAHALALSLYQAPRPTVPGFMAPDSKLLTVSEPAVLGLRAARLAAAGVTGPLDALDHPQGFLAAFSYAPLRALLGGLGTGWATRTLCVKPYPGCAYVDTTLDALLALELPAASEIDRVVVDASMLTCEMDKWSSEYAGARGRTPTPVTINFSIAWNVAIALLAGEVSPRQLRAEWLAEHRAELADLAGRVELRHDWELTRSSAEQFAGLLPPRALGRDAGLRTLRRGLSRVRGDHPSIVGGLSDLRGVGAMLRGGRRGWAAAGGSRFWSERALDRFAMTFPARVTVSLRDGRTLSGRADVPRGGAGHATEGPAAVSAAKLTEWGPALWGDDGTKAVADAIAADDANLYELLGP